MSQPLATAGEGWGTSDPRGFRRAPGGRAHGRLGIRMPYPTVPMASENAAFMRPRGCGLLRRRRTCRPTRAGRPHAIRYAGAAG